MGGKIKHGHTTSGETLYVVITNDQGDWWNGTTFESFVGANWATYAVTMNEWGSSAIYRVGVPDLPAGQYDYFIRRRAGASPAQGDPNIGQGSLAWTGTAVLDLAELYGLLADIQAAVDTEVADIKGVTDKIATAIEIDGSVYRFTANALEQAPSIGGSPPTAAAIADAVWDEAAADHVAAGSFGQLLKPDGIAEAVMDATVDGAVDVRAALRVMRAFSAGRMVRTVADPPTYAMYNAAGDTVIATIEFAPDGSERMPV